MTATALFASPAPARADGLAAPENLIAVATSPTSITLFWDDMNAGTTNYEVHNGVTSRTAGIGAHRFDWTGLDPQTYMCFRVRATAVFEYSDWAPNAPPFYVCTRSLPQESTPLPATNLNAVAVDAYTIRLTWLNNAGPSVRYEISDSAHTQTTAQGANSWFWTVTAPGTWVCFRIRAVNSVGHSEWTPYPPDWTRTSSLTVPAPPTGVVAFPVNSSTVEVTWTDNTAGTSQYQIFDGLNTYTVAAGSHSFHNTGLTPDSYHCYQIRAVNGAGQSTWVPSTRTACSFTGSVLAAPPSSVTAVAVDSYTIGLIWADHNNGQAAYEISNGVTSRFVAPGATSLNWAGAHPMIPMCFQVRAISQSGSSAWVPSTPSVCATPPRSHRIPHRSAGAAAAASIARGLGEDHLLRPAELVARRRDAGPGAIPEVRQRWLTVSGANATGELALGGFRIAV